MPDVQIVSQKVAAGASTYTLPKAAEIRLKAVNALFTDNGAAVDWIPAVVIFSDSGDVIARAADQAVLVVGGDDAEVSWFPGVKNAAAGFHGFPTALAHAPIPASLYPTATVVTPQWSSTSLSGPSGAQNSGFQFVANPVNFDLYVTKAAFYAYTVNLPWSAGFAGDRYVEIDVPFSNPMPQRLRINGTPYGDLMELSGVFEHTRDAADLVSVNVRQASGFDQTPSDIWVSMAAVTEGP